MGRHLIIRWIGRYWNVALSYTSVNEIKVVQRVCFLIYMVSVSYWVEDVINEYYLH